jgi:predicted metal-dependent TIM-barrel fold hydrolase
MDIAIEQGLNSYSVIVDHHNEETVKEVLDRDFWELLLLLPVSLWLAKIFAVT